MRLKEDDEVTLVFDDGIKRLARGQCGGPSVGANQRISWQCGTAHSKWPSHQASPRETSWSLSPQKVTELGASQIWAFPADWSVAKWDGKKLGKRLKTRKIALGAAEQSKRNLVPSITLLRKGRLSSPTGPVWLYRSGLAWRVSQRRRGSSFTSVADRNRSWKQTALLSLDQRVASPAEIESFTAKGAVLAGLGPRILRAETAPLYAPQRCECCYRLMN